MAPSTPEVRAHTAFNSRYYYPLVWTEETLFLESDRNLHILQDIRGQQVGRALPFPLSPMRPPM